MSLPTPLPIEDKLKEIDSVPLFMRSLPEGGDPSQNIALSALQSLLHEGTPDEIAQNFKEQGNKQFKARRFQEARNFYTQGLDAKPDDQKLKCILFCNRAACNLELRNFGSVLRDCASAIKLDALCSKAYFRSAQACLALERPNDAIDACQRCLSYDRDNAGIKEIQSHACALKEKLDDKAKHRQQELERVEHQKKKLREAFNARGLRVLPRDPQFRDNDNVPHFDENGRELIFPAFFLYPQYSQSDLVEHFHEETTFGEQLSQMFPPNAPAPDWDKDNEYVIGNLLVYATTHLKGILKIGMNMTLYNAINSARMKNGEPDGLELRQGSLSFIVLPNREAQTWVEEFRNNWFRDS